MRSPLLEILGITIFLSRSCDTAEEITNSKPVAVESAAASAPAANRAITQLGSCSISGFAKAKNRPLLGKPKAEFKAPNLDGV